MRNFLLMIGIMLLLVLPLQACEKEKKQDKNKASLKHLSPDYEPLDQKVTAYHDAVMWKTYKDASLYVLPYKRQEFLNKANQVADKMTIDSYRVISIEENKEGTEATVTVSRSYFMDPDITVKKDTLVQKWVMVEGEWYLSGPPY